MLTLLDTHAWIWLVEGNPRLGRAARRGIDRAAAHDAVRISAVSAFEVASLCTSGRLHLRLTPQQWVDEALDLPGVRLAEVTVAVAVDAGQIPKASLADPFDRILAATARRLDAALVTADRALLAHLKASRIHAIDASR